MSQEAARKLPRYALLALLAAFIFAGLGAQGLWTVRDAESFGIAATMAHGTLADMLLPNADGAPVYASGPLAGWVAAVFIGCFGSLLGDVAAYRLTSLFWFALSTSALWYGVWRLARRPEAQPIAFAFGGEATPRDYGRVVADSAVLLFVATFGIVTRQHEAIPDTALLALASINLYGLALTLKRPVAGSLLAGAAAGGAVLASTLFAGLWLLAATIIVQASAVKPAGRARDVRFLATAAGFAAPPLVWAGAALLAAPEAAASWFSVWASHQAENFGLVTLSTLIWFAKNFVWYLCPIWPFVVWGLYSWRRQLELTHLQIPLVLMATAGLASLFSSSQAADLVFLSFIPAMAAFAAFGLITVRRSKENILDWFSLSVHSLGVLALWAYWLAWLTNYAPKMARSVEMLAPGTQAVFDFGVVCAFLVSCIWFTFVVWRLSHRPIVAWRGPWLAALGMTATAVAAIGLFHTAIDRNRSYAPAALELRATLERAGLTENDCVAARDLPAGLRSIFIRFGGLPLAADPAASCRFSLVRDRSELMLDRMVGIPVSRPHTDERFVILFNPGRSIDRATPQVQP